MTRLVSELIGQFFDRRFLSGALIMGLFTGVVKVVAFVKELIVAHQFGTSDEVDIFVVALLVPSLMAMAVGNALRDGFIPVYSERLNKTGKEAGRLVSNVFWICAGSLAAAVILILTFDSPLIDLLSGGFSGEKRERCTHLLLWLSPYMIFFGIANYLKGFLLTHQRFIVAAAAPALLPFGTIAVLPFMPEGGTAIWLALGTSIGSFLFLVWFLVSSRTVFGERLLHRPALDPATRTVVRNSLPLLAGAAIMEAYYFIDMIMAAHLPAGSVASLNYGQRICGVFMTAGMAGINALFPHVADLANQKDWKAFFTTIRNYSVLTLVASIPGIIAIWLLAGFMVRLCFEHGEFTSDDSELVSSVVRFASFQIPSFILYLLASRAVMALQGNRLVPMVAAAGVLSNVVLNLIFMRIFGVQGIALSTAITNGMSAMLLFGYAAVRVPKMMKQQEEE